MNVDILKWNPAHLRTPVFKPMVKVLDWAELIGGALPKLVKDSRTALKQVSKGLGVFELPNRSNKLLKSFTLVYGGETVSEKAVGSIQTLKNSTSIVGVGSGAVEVMHENGLFSLSPHQLLILSFFGFICSSILVLKSLADINKSFNIITQEQLWSPEFNSNLLYLANKICRLAIGLFAMAFFLLGAELAAPLLLISTFSLALVLTRNYYRTII